MAICRRLWKAVSLLLAVCAVCQAVVASAAQPAKALSATSYVVDIRDCGAVGDGKTPCTAALQKAIDQCAARGGGTVRLPAGTWLTGTVYLESNLTLVLEKDCVLLGSRKHEDYARPRAAANPNAKPAKRGCAAVLAGAHLENVSLRGEGTIDGQGDAFRDKTRLRPKNVYLDQCRNVKIEGIRLRSAGSWMFHARHCDGLTIRKIDLFNHVAFNNDGLDIDSSRNVLIEDCRVDSDDDAIVLKSLSRDPCRNVVVRNCTISSHCNAIKMGTESGGGFQNITVKDCTVHSPRKSQKTYGAQRGLAGIALEIVDGGTLENVVVSGIRIDGVTVPIFLRLGDRARVYGPKTAKQDTPKPAVGKFRHVVLRDIVAQNVSPTGCSITGLPGHPIEDVLLENISLAFEGGGAKEQASRKIPERPESYPESTMFGVLPAYGLYGRHVTGLVLRNVAFETRAADLRHAIMFDDVKRLTIEDFRAGWAPGSAALIRMVQVEQAAIRVCKSPAGADPFLLVEGDRTRQVVLEKNDLSAAAKPVAIGDGVSPEAVSR